MDKRFDVYELYIYLHTFKVKILRLNSIIKSKYNMSNTHVSILKINIFPTFDGDFMCALKTLSTTYFINDSCNSKLQQYFTLQK